MATDIEMQMAGALAQAQQDLSRRTLRDVGVGLPNPLTLGAFAELTQTRPRRLRFGVTEVENGWLVDHAGDQFVFPNETSMVEWMLARRVQSALKGE